MSQSKEKAGEAKKTTAAKKTSKETAEQAQQGAKKVSKADKIWIASIIIILLLLGVAIASHLARGGGDTPPPVVSAAEEPDFTVDEAPFIEPEPDAPNEEVEPAPESAAATGALVVTSDVKGADVYLNGRRVGKTPHKATPLTPGRYRVRVVKAGYETFEKNVEVTATSHTLRADLKRAAAAFRVASNVRGATVALDGEARGTAPVAIAELAPGTYELVVSAPGYKTHSETVEYAGGGRDIRVELVESVTIVLSEAVAVKHKHRIRGGCEGVLRASPEGIRFESDHKDAFFVSFSELEQIGFDKNKLNVKVQGGRSYNFVERNDNEDALARFHERVDEALAQLGEGDPQEH